MLLIERCLEHNFLPLGITTVFLQLVHLVPEIVVGFLNDGESASQSLVLSDLPLDLKVLLPQLHLQLADCLLATLNLVFQPEPLLGQLTQFLLE